jgi:glutathione S-transferase
MESRCSLLTLYELANADGECTSPFVWRIKFALQAKAISALSVQVGYLEIPEIGAGTDAARSMKTVPAVEHEGRFLSESWAIAEWLDEKFSGDPRLFSSPGELAIVKFFDKWFGTAIMPPAFRSCVLDIFERVRAEDQAYFRDSREKLFGRTLEEVAADAEADIAGMREALLPMRLALRKSEYLGGACPNFADYIAWDTFIAFGLVARRPLLAGDDPLRDWVKRGVALAPGASSLDGRLTILAG